MSGRKFSMVSASLWRSARFRALPSTVEQLAYVFCLTCEHQNSTGCYRLPTGYASSDLGWADLEFETARDKLIEAGLIRFDLDTEELFVSNWFIHNPPQNPKHITGTERIIERIESFEIAQIVGGEFDAAIAEKETSNVTELLVSDTLRNSRFLTGGRR